MKKFLLLPCLVITALSFTFLATTQSQSTQEKFERPLREKLKLNVPHSVLVLLKEKADLLPAAKLATKDEKAQYVYSALTEVAMRSQKELVEYLQLKQIKYHRFYISNMIELKDAPYEVLDQISKRADVEKIYDNPNFTVRRPDFTEHVADSLARNFQQEALPEESLIRIHATQVWQNLKVRGEGIVVAGQDSGVQWDHPALIHQYRGEAGQHEGNWHDAIREPLTGKINPCGYDTAIPCDDSAHGTHTMGTVVGDDGDQNHIGVAPGAKWMACRNMDEGTGSPASYIDCFEFFLAPYAFHADPMTSGKPEKSPHVINNSWGCPLSEGCSGREMIPVLEALQSAGIFVVASAGNDGPECSSVADQPAHLSGLSLSVGAVQDKDDKIAFFSSRGPSLLTGQVVPDLTAPGMNIRSSVPGGKYEGGWSGTSMAGPHVTGVVALLWSAVPRLIGKVKETMTILRQTSRALTSTQNCGDIPGSQIPNNTFGYGLIDAEAAILQARMGTP